MGTARNKIKESQSAGAKKGKITKQKKQTSFSGTTGESGAPDDATTGVPENEDKQPKKVAQPVNPNKEYRKNGSTDSDGNDIDAPKKDNKFTVDKTSEEDNGITVETPKYDDNSATNTFKEKPASDAGEFKKADIPEELQQDDEKFDIQQGDLIDFLMKEVVLASAAWCGKKVSSVINVALYRVSSEIYYKFKDGTISTYEAYKEISQKNKEHSQHLKKCAKLGLVTNQTIEEAKKAGNSETAKIFELHNQEMNDAQRIVNSGDLYSRFVQEVMKTPDNNSFYENCQKDDKGNYYWTDKETGHKILLKNQNSQSAIDVYANKILDLQDQLDKGNLSDELKQKFGISQTPIPADEKEKLFKELSGAWGIALEGTAKLEAEAKIFAANMATAQMLKDGAKAEDINTYLAIYQAEYLSMQTKLCKGENIEELKWFQTLLGISEEAKKLSIEQNKKENGLKEPNKHLEKINKAIQANIVDDNSDTITLTQEANKVSKKMKKLNKKQQELAELLEGFGFDIEKNKEAKRRLKEVREGLNLSNVRDNVKTQKAKDAAEAQAKEQMIEAKKQDMGIKPGGRN